MLTLRRLRLQTGPDEDSDPSPGRIKATQCQGIRLRGSLRLRQLDHDITEGSTLTF